MTEFGDWQRGRGVGVGNKRDLKNVVRMDGWKKASKSKRIDRSRRKGATEQSAAQRKTSLKMER